MKLAVAVPLARSVIEHERRAVVAMKLAVNPPLFGHRDRPRQKTRRLAAPQS